MADQVVSASGNHDDFVGRGAGENFTIDSGAVLTIDSCPHLTAMGILGDIALSDGTLHIDGTRTKKVAYSSGAGTLPSVGDLLTWDAGASGGKVVRLDSGAAASGVMTVTVDAGDTLEAADTITDGAWSATVDSVEVGFLVVFGEAQVWDGTNKLDTIRVTGDWYEVGVGDGTGSQVFTLPHSGHQHAVWVETGSGTGVYQKWHRICSGASVDFFNSFAEFAGDDWESGAVFQQTFGSSTITFGTSGATGGGVVPSGARVRIPSVHVGTTTTGAPTTEVNSAALTDHIRVTDTSFPHPAINFEIDHLNASSSAWGCYYGSSIDIRNSCFGVVDGITNVKGPVYVEDCAFVSPGTATGGTAYLNGLDIGNVALGAEIKDCLMYAGTAGFSNGPCFVTRCTFGVDFTGTNKFVHTRKNTTSQIRTVEASDSYSLSFETVVSLNGSFEPGLRATVDDFAFGFVPGNPNSGIAAVLTSDIEIDALRLADGAIGNKNYVYYSDSGYHAALQRAGSPTSKIDAGNNITQIIWYRRSASGITAQRVYFTNISGNWGTVEGESFENSIINCSGDYNSSITPTSRMVIKGWHGASGSPGTGSGIGWTMTGYQDTCFLDHFTSDTTGALNLIFQPPGDTMSAYVTITSGTPVWDGAGSILMRTNGDQVVYEWPYQIRGHTAFQNAVAFVSSSGTFTYEYALDTGGGYGAWTALTGANLSAETISPSGFGFKIRITCTAAAATNYIRALEVYTNTTLADQENNYYPFDIVTATATCRDFDTLAVVEGAVVLLEADSGGPLPAREAVTSITRAGATATVTHTAHGMSSGMYVIIRGANEQAYNGMFAITRVDDNTYTYPVAGAPSTPATGTITATARILFGTSDITGVVTDTNVEYPGSAQPVTGIALKGSAAPYYKATPLAGTLTANGVDITAIMPEED